MEGILKNFNMVNARTTSSPMNTNEKLQLDDGSRMTDQTKFRGLVGRLMYLTHTCPDIYFAVGLIFRFMHEPSQHHFGAAIRILRYLAGTKGHGLWYQRAMDFKLKVFCHSDWAGSCDDRKSTTGNVFLLGSSLVSWSSKKQPVVALSSTEAENISATSAACQAIWLKKMLEDLNQKQDQAIEIFCDNQSTTAITKNPIMHGRTKHVDIKFHTFSGI